MNCMSSSDNSCLITSNNDFWLWHKRFDHLSMKNISRISNFDLVKDLLKISFKKYILCDAYQLGKQVKSSSKSKDLVSTLKPLELLHMNLFGLTRILSLNKSRYVFVIINIFLKNKNDTFN